jgi:hypothetical protein
MSKIAISGASTGTATFTIESPATSTNRTLTLPDNTGTIITQNSTPAFASTIGVGGATAAASGAGITFPATQSASSNANTLDDYEEGTYTPTAVGGTTAGTTTYNTQVGQYTKIGRMVSVEIYVNVTAMTGSGELRISLPFTSGNNDPRGVGSVWSSNLDWPGAGSISCMEEPNTSYIRLFVSSDNAAFGVINIENASWEVRIAVTYFTD